MRQNKEPRVFHILHNEALKINDSRYGSTGQLFSGEGIEAVWVSKQNEEIDTGWFSQPMVDLILVVHGQLRVEYERENFAPQVLAPGDLLILPANTRCRAYRWPRVRKEPTIFLAVYPLKKVSNRHWHT